MESESASLEGHQAIPTVIGHFGKITSEQAHKAGWLKNSIAKEWISRIGLSEEEDESAGMSDMVGNLVTGSA